MEVCRHCLNAINFVAQRLRLYVQKHLLQDGRKHGLQDGLASAASLLRSRVDSGLPGLCFLLVLLLASVVRSSWRQDMERDGSGGTLQQVIAGHFMLEGGPAMLVRAD